MKSEEYNFQLKQCGLYKAPPFQVRWGNIKLFYNIYIVCTQKNIWIHVSSQASFGIFSKRGKLSFFQRKPPKETSAPYELSLWLLPKCQTITLTSFLIGMPGCWETETWHRSPLVLFIITRPPWENRLISPGLRPVLWKTGIMMFNLLQRVVGRTKFELGYGQMGGVVSVVISGALWPWHSLSWEGECSAWVYLPWSLTWTTSWTTWRKDFHLQGLLSLLCFTRSLMSLFKTKPLDWTLQILQHSNNL